MGIKKIVKNVIRSISLKKVTAKVVSLAPNESLTGRVALITGGSGGIGFVISEAFVKSGANVVISGRNREKVTDIKKQLDALCQGNQKVMAIQMDVRKVDSFETNLNMIVKEFGKLDILVNNAGVTRGIGSMEEVYDEVLETNLKGPYFLSLTTANYMVKNKIRGNILNICSSSSLRPANSPYCLSKWGLRGLTLGLAKTYVKYGITVNGIAPGPTATSMFGADKHGRIDNRHSPIGRLTMPEEIANMAVFLVGDMGRTIIGDIIYMTGGSAVITYDDVSYGV